MKITNTIKKIDEMLVLTKKQIKLYNKLKLGLYIETIKEGNEKVLIMKFKDYVNGLRNINGMYLLERTTINFLIKSLEPKKYKKFKSRAINLIRNDTYIVIGNKNKKYVIIKGIELEKDKFVTRVNNDGSV